MRRKPALCEYPAPGSQHCPRSCLAPPSFPSIRSLPVNGLLRVTLVMSSPTETLLGCWPFWVLPCTCPSLSFLEHLLHDRPPLSQP